MSLRELANECIFDQMRGRVQAWAQAAGVPLACVNLALLSLSHLGNLLAPLES